MKNKFMLFGLLILAALVLAACADAPIPSPPNVSVPVVNVPDVSVDVAVPAGGGGGGGGEPAGEAPDAIAPEPSTPTSWEYLIVTCGLSAGTATCDLPFAYTASVGDARWPTSPTAREDMLKELGAENWSLVSTTQGEPGTATIIDFYFKRPLK